MKQEFIKVCFLIALDDELSDLKGMVSPASVCDVDEFGEICSFEVELRLLSILDDPHIKVMMQSLELLSVARYNLQLRNKMEGVDANPDEKAIDLANKTFNRFFPWRGAPKIRTRRTMLRMLPQHYQKCYLALWACSEQLLRSRISISKTSNEDFERASAFLSFDDLETDNNNANFIYSLLSELQQNELLLPKKVKK
ncbi:hypothetical protein ACXZ1K_05285 [Pedobacter sp. PWIIR3]